jgi:hypothetical protein
MATAARVQLQAARVEVQELHVSSSSYRQELPEDAVFWPCSGNSSLSYEEEDTCMSYEEEDTSRFEGQNTCHMRRRIHVCHMRRRIHRGQRGGGKGGLNPKL